MEGSRGGSLGGPSAEREKTKIEMAMREHELALKMLTEVVAALEERIKPVRAPRPESVSKDVNPPYLAGSPLLEWLDHQTANIKALGKKCYQTVEEIEL